MDLLGAFCSPQSPVKWSHPSKHLLAFRAEQAGAKLMFLTQMMDLVVAEMRGHLNSNTSKGEYFNQVKVKIKSVQSSLLSFIVM